MSDTLTVGSYTLPGIIVLNCNDDDAPEPDYEAIPIPGRSGDLHIWNRRWKNKMITYHCFCPANARTVVPGVLVELMKTTGYRRITDTLHTDYYKMGEYIGGTAPVYSDGGATATFDLTFDCKPQKWLLSGEDEIEITSTNAQSPTHITNPTGYPAFPLLEITGYGLCRVMSPSYSVTISSDAGVAITSPNPIIHDCEINRTHSVNGSTSYDQYATVSISSVWANNPGVTSTRLDAYHASTAALKIVPRWWKL